MRASCFANHIICRHESRNPQRDVVSTIDERQRIGQSLSAAITKFNVTARLWYLCPHFNFAMQRQSQAVSAQSIPMNRGNSVKKHLLLVAATLLGTASLPAQTIETYSGAPFGLFDVQLSGFRRFVGQTLVVPGIDNRVFASWSFWIQGGPSFRYQTSVRKWDGTAAGDILWSSGETENANEFRTRQTWLPNIDVMGGTQLVLLFERLDGIGSVSGKSPQTPPIDWYESGTMVTSDEQGGGIATVAPYLDPSNEIDAAFSAVFTNTVTVPEPSSGALLAVGLVGFLVIRPRSSKSKAALRR